MCTMAPQVAMIASRQMVWSYASVTCAHPLHSLHPLHDFEGPAATPC